MLQKIISGGQTGVDSAALKLALDLNLTTGGWCPPDGKNEDGLIFSGYGLKRTPYRRSKNAPDVARSLRTEWNVRDSDASLILKSESFDEGTQWTIKAAVLHEKPYIVLDLKERSEAQQRLVLTWLRDIKPNTLNVAGPAESIASGIEKLTYSFLYDVFTHVIKNYK